MACDCLKPENEVASGDGKEVPAMTEKASYEVGYGKPPKHTQIKPGEVKNPGGKTSAQKKAEMANAQAKNELMAKMLLVASQDDAEASLEEIMNEVKIAISSFGVPVDKALARNAVDYFGSMDQLQNWATRTLSGALAELGVDVAKLRARDAIPTATRYKILERAGFKCQACGAKPAKSNDVKLHIDHIIPVSLGGASALKNLQCLCAECNISKGNKSVYDHNEGWS